jgi:hypothetical protein
LKLEKVFKVIRKESSREIRKEMGMEVEKKPSIRKEGKYFIDKEQEPEKIEVKTLTNWK